jgi:molecular chaperone GrpE
MKDGEDAEKAEAAAKAGDAEKMAPEVELAALREKAAKAEEYLDLAKRARADFLNYQDRIRREKPEWARQALEGFVRDFLPALDALTGARFEDPRLTEALQLIAREFTRVLAKHGIVPVETAGKTFDPLYHEAVSVEVTDGKADGTVLEEVRRGWMLDGRVLRPASVRIAKAPPSVPGA